MKFTQPFRLMALILASNPLVVGAGFVAPAEGPLPFRRDRIPLEVEQIARLSNQLESLVLGLDPTLGANRRAAAQMLALATALDPSNTSARDLITDFQLGNPPPSSQADELGNAQKAIWRTLEWLKAPEAGVSANALARCLTDVIHVSDPQHEGAASLRDAGETGAWDQWVAQPAAFEKKANPPDEMYLPSAEVLENPPEAAPPALASAELPAVLWIIPDLGNRERYGEPVLGRAPLRMSATRMTPDDGDAASFSIGKDPDFSTYPLGSMNHFKDLLENQHTSLPADLTITFSCPLFRPARQRERPGASRSLPSPPKLQALKPNTIDAAAATLASAAISGRVPDATIIGVLNAEGEFLPGGDFWNKIEILCENPGEGKRLIVPTAAGPSMLAVLALEKARFFLDYEVVSASNFSELLERSAVKLGDTNAAASARFKEIRDKSINLAVGQYVANPFIRRRLAELATECPQHISAKLLSLQGSGSRPTQISREVLIPMLRKALTPVERLINEPEDRPYRDAATLLRFGEQCRDSLTNLERFVEKADLPLFAKAQDIVVALRALERAARSYNRDVYGVEQLEASQKNLLSAYGLAAADLGLKTGNPESPPPTE